MNIIRELLDEAVEDCVTCDGRGYIEPPRASTIRSCVDCGGEGEMLTDQGLTLADFLTKWLAPKFAQVGHRHTLS